MDEVFGPFRLVSLIARGGMAETFVAERTRPDGSVERTCVKRILAAESGLPNWISLFKREARIVATLQHPNIVALHDFGEVRGVWWMSLELIDGVTLRALMTARKAAGTRLSVDAVVLIATELAKALAYAHGRRESSPSGVVHRDVTPTNVMITSTGVVKLVDFGIAKVMDDDRVHTGTGKAGSKPGYMSPEQCHEQPVDHRTDLFSLGVVLFEALAGTRPFDGATVYSTRLNTVNGVKKDLRALAPETPEALAEIIESLIETDQEARMASADALIEKLRSMPSGSAVGRTLGAWARGASETLEGVAKAGPTRSEAKPPTGWS